MTERENRILQIVMAGILLVSMFIVAREGAVCVNSMQIKSKEKKCIVIDAGHGGFDPGKVGINGQLEKDINLEIARYLKQFMQAEGIEVVMTRQGEEGLYDENASNKKVQDMKRRLETIEKADPVLVVSIHQNSYHEEYVKGAQVFYYATSANSKGLAEILQERLLARRFWKERRLRTLCGLDLETRLTATQCSMVLPIFFRQDLIRASLRWTECSTWAHWQTMKTAAMLTTLKLEQQT